MSARSIFTVTAGRSGQSSLTDLLNRNVPGCLAIFEGPAVEPVLPRVLGDLERRFRRRFIETHELLGRGRVLTAFDAGDDESLDRMAAQRLAWIDRRVTQANATVYVDVSKYFARGLHRAIVRARPDLALIRLVRDPIANMRSFLNRSKNFYLDNTRPDAPLNRLRLDPATLSPGELYLWAWCEMYLRFDSLVEEFDIATAIEIRTEQLDDAECMAAHLSALGLPHETVETAEPANTNVAQGYGRTAVQADDIATFEQFLGKLPTDIRNRIAYFGDFDPRSRYRDAAAA